MRNFNEPVPFLTCAPTQAMRLGRKSAATITYRSGSVDGKAFSKSIIYSYGRNRNKVLDKRFCLIHSFI